MADAGIEPALFFCLFLVLRGNALPSNNELKTWQLATVVLVLLAAFVFFSQRFIGRFFDSVFEIFIFYIPAVLIVLLFFYLWRRPRV